MKKNSLVIILLITLASTSIGQVVDTVKTQGAEVLDIFFLRNINDKHRDSLFNEYRKELFPIATEYGYSPIRSFRMKRILEGSKQPDFVLFSKWTDYQRREKFIDDIVKLKPFFHDLRRSIWSTFDLTYYKMDKDLTFSIDQSRYNVISSLWTDGSCAGLGNSLQRDIIAHDGDIVLYLPKGKSPIGYYYNPDHFIISSWSNKAQFDAFTAKRNGTKCLININEFEI